MKGKVGMWWGPGGGGAAWQCWTLVARPGLVGPCPGRGGPGGAPGGGGGLPGGVGLWWRVTASPRPSGVGTRDGAHTLGLSFRPF